MVTVVVVALSVGVVLGDVVGDVVAVVAVQSFGAGDCSGNRLDWGRISEFAWATLPGELNTNGRGT